MTRTNRILALLLVLVMFAALFAACTTGTTKKQDEGDTDTDSDSDTDVPENTEAELPEGLRFDASGTREEIRFIVADDITTGATLSARSIEVSEEDKDANGVNSAIHERNTTVENRIGVDIILDKVTTLMGMSEEMQDFLTGGIDYYDVTGGFQIYAMGLALGSNAGNYLNYYDLDEEDNYIDFEKPYWDKELTSEASYLGSAYWATGDISLYYTGGIFVTFVNAAIWNRYSEKIKELTGYTDIYDVVNNNCWTVDLMCKLINEVWIDRNGNEKVDKEDQAGYIGIHDSDTL